MTVVFDGGNVNLNYLTFTAGSSGSSGSSGNGGPFSGVALAIPG